MLRLGYRTRYLPDGPAFFSGTASQLGFLPSRGPDCYDKGCNSMIMCRNLENCSFLVREDSVHRIMNKACMSQCLGSVSLCLQTEHGVRNESAPRCVKIETKTVEGKTNKEKTEIRFVSRANGWQERGCVQQVDIFGKGEKTIKLNKRKTKYEQSHYYL